MQTFKLEADFTSWLLDDSFEKIDVGGERLTTGGGQRIGGQLAPPWKAFVTAV